LIMEVILMQHRIRWVLTLDFKILDEVKNNNIKH
jgi:hypothetical protein